MLSKITFLVFAWAGLSYAIVYDRYTGEQASDELLKQFEESGVTSTCTMEVADCDATERRRADGTCNNLDNPVRGTYFEPTYRLLKANYYNGSLPAKTVSGSENVLPRVARTHLLAEGKTTNARLTQAVPGFGVFGTFMDIGSIHDIAFFLVNKTNCCTAEGMADPQCTPIIIPEDDPVHRFSGIRCLNNTRPLVYSDFGCTNDTEPSPIEQATGVYDLSSIYNFLGGGDSPIRSYVNGTLIVDVDENGTIFPPNGNGFCLSNQPGETRCFEHYPSNLLSITLFSIWYVRQHNHFASQLAAVNPHWDDETIYQTARDINIASYMQVMIYEWLVAVVGREYLLEKGIISNSTEHRDIYDDSTYPMVSVEFVYGLRWFHTIQEGSANLYYPDGTYKGQFPYVNGTARPGLFGVDNNMIYFTQHMYRQACGKVDHEIDYELAENGLSIMQLATDIPSADLSKGRLLGLRPYVDYVYSCTGHKVESFDDLKMHMEDERVEQMKRVYNDPNDIDFMAGLWSENTLEGGHIPATLACVLTDYLKRAIQSDRHWYESPNRPYAFNEAQLKEIRKYTLSRLFCDVGDMVTEVQPNVFHTISSDNPLTPCSELPSIDFTKWSNSTSNSSSNSSDDGFDSSAESSSYSETSSLSSQE